MVEYPDPPIQCVNFAAGRKSLMTSCKTSTSSSESKLFLYSWYLVISSLVDFSFSSSSAAGFKTVMTSKTLATMFSLEFQRVTLAVLNETSSSMYTGPSPAVGGGGGGGTCMPVVGGGACVLVVVGGGACVPVIGGAWLPAEEASSRRRVLAARTTLR